MILIVENGDFLNEEANDFQHEHCLKQVTQTDDSGIGSSSNSSSASGITEDDFDFSDESENVITKDDISNKEAIVEEFRVVDNPVVERKVKEFCANVRVRDFFCKFDPWLVVPSGSFLDLFDWVPESQRIGPWTLTSKVYFTAILYSTVLFGSYILGQARASTTSMFADNDNLEYPPLFSGWWCYNVVAFGWMCYIIHNIIYHTPVSGFAWVTYTVQSWTLLTLRHGLCILAPISPTALFLSELIRFPCAVSPALTFTVWNFIIFPLAYCFFMKTAEHKMMFFKVSTCFPMMNLHVLNILLCVLNVVYSTPPRKLNIIDFYVAFVILVLYMAWYFLILDRMGFHLYKEYSPRSHPLITITTWSATIAGYVYWFFVFRDILMPTDNDGSRVKEEL